MLHQVMGAASSILSFHNKEVEDVGRANAEATILVDAAYARAQRLLQVNLEAVHDIAEQLIEEETVPMSQCIETVKAYQELVIPTLNVLLCLPCLRPRV